MGLLCWSYFPKTLNSMTDSKIRNIHPLAMSLVLSAVFGNPGLGPWLVRKLAHWPEDKIQLSSSFTIVDIKSLLFGTRLCLKPALSGCEDFWSDRRRGLLHGCLCLGTQWAPPWMLGIVIGILILQMGNCLRNNNIPEDEETGFKTRSF